MLTKHTTPLLLSSIFILSACGGGGGESAAGATSASPQVASVQAASALSTTLKNDPTCAIQYAINDSPELSGPDPMLDKQWHLKNTGQKGGKLGEDINVEGAWKVSLGEGVRIALVDDALETVHGDLKSNVVAGASYNYRPAIKGSAFPLPCSKDEGHGTSVAGIIASRAANALGTSGIAPKAQLVGYNALSLDLTADIADALTRDLANNMIYHNSWGSPDNGEINEAETEFNLAITRGIRDGRKGKGAIYVFPAGNGGCYSIVGSAGCQRDNSNFDGYVNKLGVIAVGAVDQFGRSPWYAENGSNILVSAPAGDSSAGITTTAIGNRFREDFAGTSASAPMVSGAIALMLSTNPQLSWRDVPVILAKSARKNDANDSSWVGNFSHKYGFGVLDASAAVQMAKSWVTVGGMSEMKTCTQSIKTGNTSIPDGGALIGSAISLSACGISKIEYVSVTINATHEYSGDLEVSLYSPNGTSSLLATPRKCGATDRNGNTCGDFTGWQFGSVRHMDEAASGNWQLFVRDTETGKVGSLQGWTITVHGR
jgi:proprotein convertase subtilisin/kexin type 2